ncbi:MAG: PD-(D/E)XK nuclease family protein [Candidatus Electryonea clarkiae]|nr:PD-(D/E)XK nuclease family protein [Candidatus Electryonea clarkiae]MDP8287002.1 PD-(D/E)XK nuclease family protein [Candidatus Electryonea clarkiae]
MESLFSRLQSYRPRPERDSKEDFFTEAFCYILEKNPKVLKAYIKHLLPNDSIEFAEQPPNIATQYKFGGKRPDVMIEFEDKNSEKYFIICEHKLNAREGTDQLADYYETLSIDLNNKEFKVGLLECITKYSEIETSMEKVKRSEVKYHEQTWRNIYPFMMDCKDNDLVIDTSIKMFDDFLNYMEELGMTRPAKYSAFEMAEFCKIPKLLQILDECIDGEAREEFNSIQGGKNQIVNFQNNSNWIRYKTILNGSIELNIGVYLDSEDFWSEITEFGDPDYPELVIYLSSNPSKEIRKKLLEFCKEFTAQYKSWKYLETLDWDWMVLVHISMRDFIGFKENQIAEIQKWYSNHLIELKKFIEENEI